MEMLIDLYEKVLGKCPQKGITFIRENGQRNRLTYAEIAEKAVARGAFLKDSGCRPKDFLIFQIYDDQEFLIHFWACIFYGFVPVLMNPALEIPGAPAEGETLKKIYFHLDKPKIIVSETMYGAYLELAGKTGIERSHMIHTGEGGGRETGGEFFLPKERHLSPEDTALLFLTSGTTGTPKCVMQTNKAAVSRENALKKVFDYENRTFLNWMPLEHPGGLFMAHLNGLSNYGEQIQVEKGYILQNITRWLDLIEEFQVNWSWAPHFAYVLLKKEAEKQTVPRDLSSVVNLLDGGEMVDARTGKEFVRFFEKFGLRECALQPAWGMCETCSGVLYNNDFNFGSGGTAEYKGRTFTKIGKPLPGIDVRIVDEKGVPLKDGEVGVFQIRGKEVTKGYYKNAGENENVFTEDGWFNTGDAGFLSEGSVILTGREKDVVIVNGLNYANAEIEALIGELEEVRSSYVAVCQCVDQNGAEQVIAFFTPQSHTEPVYARRKVLAEVKKKLHIHLAEAIPLPQEEVSKSNLEKIQRARIAKKYQDGGFKDIQEAMREKEAKMKRTEIPDWFLKEIFVKERFAERGRVEALRLMVSHNYLKGELARLAEIAADSGVIIFQGDFPRLRALGQKIARGQIPCSRLICLTECRYPLEKRKPRDVPGGQEAGFLKCLEAECGAKCMLLDIDDFSDPVSVKTAVSYIRRGKAQSGIFTVRKEDVFQLKLEAMDSDDGKGGFTYGGLYIVTGGLGGIGRLLCRYLLSFYRAKIVMIGRRDIEKDSQYRQTLCLLKQIAETVHYEKANVADYEAIKRVVEKYEQKYRMGISEILHLSGVGNLKEHWQKAERRLIANCDEELYEEMFEAKITGTRNLYRIAADRKDVRLLLFGSTNGFFGTASFGAYSAANSFLPAFARAKQQEGENILCVNSGSWKNTGLSYDSGFEDMGRNKGFYDIEGDAGVISIERCLGAKACSVYIGLDQRKNYIKKYMLQEIPQEEKKQEREISAFDEMDRRLIKIWEKVLDGKVRHPGDDFFELGGDSIKAFQLPKEIQKEFGTELSAREIFRFSRFDEMKKRIKERVD